MQSRIRPLLISLLFFGLVACKNDQSTSTPVETPPSAQQINIPSFNRDSAYAYIAQQVAFGPRVPNTEAHLACKDWLVAKLRSFGATVSVQNFTGVSMDGKDLNGFNIMAQYNPQSSKRILFGAHWDTRPVADSPLSRERQEEPILGADDGASGVGILLELARTLGTNPVDMGVDIVFFDIEDSGISGGENWAQGAQYWSKNLPYSGNKPRYGVLLDMVGSKGARFAKEVHSQKFAQSIVTKVWNLAAYMGYGNYFIDRSGGQVTDDHYFVNTIARIPMIDIINQVTDTPSGFGAYWHTHDDDMQVIDKATIRAVGKVITALVYREDSGTI